jgi:hypothetical protein
MKPLHLLALAPLVVPGLCVPSGLHKLCLPDPQNWVAGDKLFPTWVIAGYNADYDKYTNDTWADYILAKCKEFEHCTSTNSFSGRLRYLRK